VGKPKRAVKGPAKRKRRSTGNTRKTSVGTGPGPVSTDDETSVESGAIPSTIPDIATSGEQVSEQDTTNAQLAQQMAAAAAAPVPGMEDIPQVDEHGAPVATDAAPVESWTPAIKSVMPMIRIGVLPQWDITDDESEGFAQSLGECLDQAFPGGMNGKYACWARLLIIVTAVPATRYMQHGKLPPFGPKLKAVSAETRSNEVATASPSQSNVATEI